MEHKLFSKCDTKSIFIGSHKEKVVGQNSETTWYDSMELSKQTIIIKTQFIKTFATSRINVEVFVLHKMRSYQDKVSLLSLKKRAATKLPFAGGGSLRCKRRLTSQHNTQYQNTEIFFN